jgi:hypothetical protein
VWTDFESLKGFCQVSGVGGGRGINGVGAHEIGSDAARGGVMEMEMEMEMEKGRGTKLLLPCNVYLFLGF